jgi:hypothetical protein
MSNRIAAIEDGDQKDEKGSSITLHAHGDGTYHTTSESWGGGKRTEHPSMGHALMHIASRHAEGDHVHILSDDDGFTTHHVMEGGKVKGPHEHANRRELIGHLRQTLAESADESED